MSVTLHTDPARRHDFLLLFDVTDGNPNGDPDAGNLPRTDPQTGHGIVTDVCLKRKVRNYVAAARPGAPGSEIYVQEKAVLAQQHQRAYDALGSKATVADARRKMCELFYDVRLFGAVMSLKESNAGQVRGPIQFTFGRSIDPVAPLDLPITRMAVATTKEAAAQSGDNRTMGRKTLLPYALYVARGFVSAALAAQTGVTADDLTLFWDALQMMWDVDRSAARGMMACRGLYVFTHETPLGNAPAHKLFDTLVVRKKDGVETPRRFDDYVVAGPRVPDDYEGKVALTRLIEG
ncbi:MAG: type I-C CRISPR-associated protein Cas7/Csd2 [Capsulimonadales bacterium]|nr:type I-C CRISPR-associated protein Cas7/Csd2 [Capsulimonadales bacterium]